MSLLLAIALASAGPIAVPDRESEIVVLGRRMNVWRGNFRSRQGRIVCKTTYSTGDAGVDAVGCAAMTTCVTPHLAALQAIADSREPKTERNRRMTELMQSTFPCMMKQRDEGIAALADRRALEASK